MKNTSLKPQTNIPQSKPYIHEVQNISDSIYEDEMVKYINDLSNSIKQIYKSNIMNFKQMTNILETENQNNNQLNKESNDYYKNLVHDTFNNIKESFTTFYQNAKDIFKKMKQYRSQKIEIEMKKDLNLKAKKNNQIQKTNLENNNKISLLNDEINQLKIKNSDLQIQLNSLNIAYKKTKEFLEYQNSNNNHINKVYSQEQTKFLETQLSLLSKKNIELSSKLFATNNNNTLKKEKDEINQKLNNDILLLNEKVNNLENIITVLNNEKEKMENEKQKLIEENKKMKDNYLKLFEQNKQKNEEFEKLNYNNTNNQLKEIIDINKKLISDKENYKNIISEKNELLLKQKTEIEKLNKNIITEKERSLKLSNMIGEYKVNNLEKEENSKKQIQLYNQKEDELKKQIEKLNKEIDIKDKANSLLNEKLSKKEEEILKFNQNMNMNENQNENLKKKIIEISELNKKNLREINNLQEELKIAKTNEIKLMKDIKEKEIQFDSLNKTIENYQNLIIDTEKKMNMKNNEIDRIKNEKENEKKELQNKTNKYEIEKKELQNKINKYEIEKKELNNNINKIEKEKEELNEKINK